MSIDPDYIVLDIDFGLYFRRVMTLSVYYQVLKVDITIISYGYSDI